MSFSTAQIATQDLAALPPTAALRPQLIKLSRWLDATYREDAPRIETARRWARDGNIHPSPIKHGREFFVQPSAVYVPTAALPRADVATASGEQK